jgi:carboxylate-amine ligase
LTRFTRRQRIRVLGEPRLGAGKAGTSRDAQEARRRGKDTDAFVTTTAPVPLQSEFGSEAPFALGVEEELLLVDDSNELRDAGPRILDDADPDEGHVTGELFQAMVETNSEISATAGETTETLRRVRRELLDSGARLIGAGVHPTAVPGDADVHQTERFTLIEDSLQGVLRTPICGQHVHVGMPDEETAVRAYNGIRIHVPLINALAANSPFWFGEDSGLASARTVIFRSYPRAAMAPAFDDFAHFKRVTREVCVAGGLDDYTHIWWDVRLHPKLGTIEVRAPDTQHRLERAGAIAALIHCLARIEAERDQDEIPSREALAESSFQATRHGLAANLLSRDGESVPAAELAAETLELAATVAGDLGCRQELEQVETILAEGGGADLQRRVHEEEGMDGLLAYLVEETARLEPEPAAAGRQPVVDPATT